MTDLIQMLKEKNVESESYDFNGEVVEVFKTGSISYVPFEE